jgi:hypothetical protein
MATAFMVTEQFFWPNRGTVDEQDSAYERMRAGFAHRQHYVDQGKLQWFARLDTGIQGILIFKLSFEELQLFFQEDPFYGLIKREVVSLEDASHYASLFDSVAEKVDLSKRAESPILSGDLSITQLVPDMRARLADTDLNY